MSQCAGARLAPPAAHVPTYASSTPSPRARVPQAIPQLTTDKLSSTPFVRLTTKQRQLVSLHSIYNNSTVWGGAYQHEYYHCYTVNINVFVHLSKLSPLPSCVTLHSHSFDVNDVQSETRRVTCMPGMTNTASRTELVSDEGRGKWLPPPNTRSRITTPTSPRSKGRGRLRSLTPLKMVG